MRQRLVFLVGLLLLAFVAGVTIGPSRSSAFTVTAGAASSLQQSYNAGNTIAEAGALPVAISSTTADNGNVLTLTKNPVAAHSGVGLLVTMGAATTGNGITVTITAGGSGLSGLFSGGTMSCPDGASSERFGAAATASGANAATFGANSTASGTRSVAFGESATATATDTTALGNGAVASVANAVAIGRNSNASASGAVAINAPASGTNAVSINGSGASGINAVALGPNSQANFNYSVGLNGVTTGINQCALGSNGAPIYTIIMGNGDTNANPLGGGQAIWRVTNASGADTPGGGTDYFVGSAGTGTGTPGNAGIQTSWPLASGSTLQTTYDRIYASGNVKSLSTVSATTTTFCKMSCAVSNSSIGGVVYYTVFADDGTNFDVTTGSFSFVAANKAGTVTTFAGPTVETPNTPQNSGTLSNADAVTVTGTNVNLQIIPSWVTIVPTNVQIQYTIVPFGQTLAAPQ